MPVQPSPSSTKYPWGHHPNSLKNLIPFKPGQNGNPHPNYPLKERLQDALRRPLKKPDDNAPSGEHVVYTTITGALAGLAHASNQVWDRCEGKVTQPIAGADGKLLVIKVVYEERRRLENDS